MKGTSGKAALAALFVGGAALAGAQSNGPLGLSARVGVFLPTNDRAQQASDTWFAFGADYKFNFFGTDPVNKVMPTYLSLSADYYGENGFHAIPIGLNFNVRADHFVFAAGVDVDFDRVVGDDTTGIGGQVSATYEFPNSGKATNTPLFIQAKYFLSPKSELDGFGVYLGARF